MIDEKHVITSCIRKCPFYENTMDGMSCGHPYWDDKPAYSEMIITQANGNGRLPDKCPLRKGELVIKKTIRLR